MKKITLKTVMNEDTAKNTTSAGGTWAQRLQNIVPKDEKVVTNEVKNQVEIPVEQCRISNDADVLENSQQNIENVNACEPLLTREDIIMYCFLKSLNTTMKEAKFPLLLNLYYKLHFLAACPPPYDVDIKKSQYKKFSLFMEAMEKEGIVKLEKSKDAISVRSVDFKHSKVLSFRPLAEDRRAVTSQGKKVSSVTAQPVADMLVVNGAVSDVFAASLVKSGTSVTKADARRHVIEYIRSNNLRYEQDESLVCLDEVLLRVLYPVEARATAAGPRKLKFVKWNEVIEGVLGKMGKPKSSNKGNLSPIQMRIENKTGNKKVTLVDNLEAHGINMDEFGKKMRVMVGASATVNEMQHQRVLKYPQFQIQGNQVLAIHRTLVEDYKIQPRYITGLELAPKQPKKKVQQPITKAKVGNVAKVAKKN